MKESLWKRGLSRSRKGLAGRLAAVFSGKTRIDESLLDTIEEILVEADVGVDAAMDIMEHVEEQCAGRAVTATEVRQVVRQCVIDMVSAVQQSGAGPVPGPRIILVAGVNGSGKTTTIGKLAGMYKKQGKRVLLAAADTFRAAASEQLGMWAKRTGSDIVLQKPGADPASVAYDAIEAGLSRGVDVILIDTAGRLQNKVNLMEELRKIHRVIQKKVPDAPHEVLLVIDATTGQNGLSQARIFTEATGITGIVLTKLDGTARGGIVVAICRELGIPVVYAGLGEGMEDLAPFDAQVFAQGLVGE